LLEPLIDFGLAWRLLTVVPLPFVPEDFNRPAGRGTAYYPLVGLIFGLVLAATDYLVVFLLPEMVTTALTLTLWVGITGMLHLDGFMDACDGLLPPRAPARRLEIMKDSRVGAFGVVGAILLLLLKFNALAALSGMPRLFALIVTPVLARWAMTWAMARYPLARREGLAVLFGQGLGWTQVGIASLVALAVAVSLFGLGGLILVLASWLTVTLVAQLAVARIGGLTGDVYGAICEISEVVLLVVIVGYA